MQENLEIKKYLEENGISQAHVGNRAGINLTKLNLSLQVDGLSDSNCDDVIRKYNKCIERLFETSICD